MCYNPFINERILVGNIIEIFAKCISCGLDGSRVRHIERAARNTDDTVAAYRIGDDRFKDNNDKYIEYLSSTDINSPTAIVVINGSEIHRLDQWNYS